MINEDKVINVKVEVDSKSALDEIDAISSATTELENQIYAERTGNVFGLSKTQLSQTGANLQVLVDKSAIVMSNAETFATILKGEIPSLGSLLGLLSFALGVGKSYYDEQDAKIAYARLLESEQLRLEPMVTQYLDLYGKRDKTYAETIEMKYIGKALSDAFKIIPDLLMGSFEDVQSLLVGKIDARRLALDELNSKEDSGVESRKNTHIADAIFAEKEMYLYGAIPKLYNGLLESGKWTEEQLGELNAIIQTSQQVYPELQNRITELFYGNENLCPYFQAKI